MKWLAIDYGERRMGVAVGQDETGMAFPRPWIDCALVEPWTALATLIREEKPEQILMGLPLRTDGKPSEKADKVQAFAALFTEKFGLKPVFRDESFTSVVAKEKTSHYTTKKKKTEKGRIDSAAACVLLQEHLEERRR